MTDEGTSVKGRPGGATRLKGLLLVLTVLVSLSSGIREAGLWDPPELEVAEFSRRIAASRLGGDALRLPDLLNSVPTQTELGRGQLPFTSIALGFRVFGLHEWAGRAPLVVWGALGVAATALLALRFVGPRVATLSALVLSTMPLYFVQARTMLGDVVTMAVLTWAICCFSFAVFGDRVGRVASPFRVAVWLLAAAFFCSLGVLCRGLLPGVALPMLAVGVTYWLLPVVERPWHRLPRAVALGLMGGGFLALVLGGLAEKQSLDLGKVTLWSGMLVQRPTALPAFDTLVVQLGHGLLPWSAFLPVALWRLAANARLEGGLLSRRVAREAGVLRVLLIVTLALSFVGLTWLAPWVGVFAFPAVFALGIAVALALDDLNQSKAGSRLVSVSTLGLMLILVFDIRNFPDKILTPFVVAGQSLPADFVARASASATTTLLPLVALFALLYWHRDSAQPWLVRGRYSRWPRTLAAIYGGNLQFAILVVSLGAVALFLGSVVSDSVFHFEYFERMPVRQRAVLEFAWWVGPCLVWGVPWLLVAMADLSLLLVHPARALETLEARGETHGVKVQSVRLLVAVLPAPGWLAGGVLALGGLSLSVGLYPALASELSPKAAFEAYRSLAGPREALGILGPSVSARAHYYAGSPVTGMETSAEALAWLLKIPEERRWLLLPESELAPLDSEYRAANAARHSLPVLYTQSGSLFLASNSLAQAPNQNPFAHWFSAKAPLPRHPMDANLGGVLDVLGWEIRSAEGDVVAGLTAGKPSQFVIFYKVVGQVTEDWRSFVHIDGMKRRINVDHEPLEGRYPLPLWQVGDHVADVHHFTVAPDLAAGRYRVYFGLFSGSRRLEVERGQAENNRLDGGALLVR